MGLRLRAKVPLPPGGPGGFDHGDVDRASGRVFVAHTAYGTVDVIEANSLEAAVAITGCPEGSGLTCANDERAVFAASRGAGKVLQFHADTFQVGHEYTVGPKPNGLAWDPSRRRLLVADVDPADQQARLFDAVKSSLMRQVTLPGRPRWCVFDHVRACFLINIREPAVLVSMSAESGDIKHQWPILSPGPHGLDLDAERRRAFVACDGNKLVVIDLDSGREVATVAISGEPDAIWFNPRRARVYVGIATPGVIDVIDTLHFVLAETIPTDTGAKTSAFDVDRERLYVFLPESCAAAVFEDG